MSIARRLSISAGMTSSLWRGPFAEGAIAVLAVFALFALLRSPLLVDDTEHIAKLISQGVAWDTAHILMQPTGWLAHRLFGLGDDYIRTQTLLNMAAVAIALGLCHVTFRELGLSWALSAMLVAFVACTFNVLALAPTGHIKTLVFPFVVASLYCAIRWEAEASLGKAELRLLCWSATWLGLSIAYLANAALVLPFMLAVVAFRAYLRERNVGAAILRAVLFGFIASAAAGVWLLLAYVMTADSLSVAGLIDFLLKKHGLHIGYAGFLDGLLRTLYSITYNFSYTPQLGPVMRAYLDGQILDLWPYAPALTIDAAAFAATTAALVAAYALATWEAFRRGAPMLSIWAFTLGYTAFFAYWNINDPEYLFQLSALAAACLAIVARNRAGTALLIAFATLVAANNLIRYSIPRATFPLEANEAELRSTFEVGTLAVYFQAYSGRPGLRNFSTPNLDKLPLDMAYAEIQAKLRTDGVKSNASIAERQLEILRQRIDQAFDGGRRAVVFRILDERDWDAPWMLLTRSGLTKRRIVQFVHDNWEVHPLGEIAAIPAWELRKRNPQ